MAEEGFFLTKESGNALLQMVQDYRKSSRGQASYGVPGDMDGYPPDDIFAPECYVAEIPAGGIPPIQLGEQIIPGSALCNIYKISLTADGENEPLVDADFQLKVHNLSTEWITGVSGETGTGTGASQRFQLIWRDKFGRWFAEKGAASTQLVELCAQEDAERNVVYDCLKGTWDPDLGLWCYDDAPTVKAIDHREGMPNYAEEGWKGLYQEMPSTEYGLIYVLVTLDCSRPSEGCSCSTGTGTGS